MARWTPRSECIVVAERRSGDLIKDRAAEQTLFASDTAVAAGRSERIWRLAKALRLTRPDVVVSMLSPLVTIAAASIVRAPVIHWLQAPWSYTAGVVGPQLVPRSRRFLLRRIAHRSALIAAATPGLVKECARLGLPSSRLALLPNGLVLPPMPARRSENRTERTIVTVGRLEPQKRHDLLIRAFAQVARALPVRLVVVGSGRFKRPLMDLSKRLGLSTRVEFTGFVADPIDHMASADVFVLATDHEGFGNVLVEALACGVPIIVSDVPYGPEFILDHGRYGELVRPRSVNALERAMREALDRGPQTDAERAEARNRAECFSIDRVSARFERLVDLVLDGPSRPTAAELRWP
jgi:glycosyltransferase involved in cell wall biosynthesis